MLRKLYKKLSITLGVLQGNVCRMEYERAQKDHKRLVRLSNALYAARQRAIYDMQNLEHEYDLDN